MKRSIEPLAKPFQDGTATPSVEVIVIYLRSTLMCNTEWRYLLANFCTVLCSYHLGLVENPSGFLHFTRPGIFDDGFRKYNVHP